MSRAYEVVFVTFFAVLAVAGIVLGIIGRAYARRARQVKDNRPWGFDHPLYRELYRTDHWGRSYDGQHWDPIAQKFVKTDHID